MQPREQRSFIRFVVATTLVAALGATNPGCSPSEEPVPAPACDAGDRAFVRRALLALDGRRAWSQAEVDVWTQLIAKLVERGETPVAARRLVARAMMFEDDTFRERWSVFLMDSLRVLRSVFARGSDSWLDKTQATLCYGPELLDAEDDGVLAAWVRDNPPTEQSPPFPAFRLGRLLSSALALDDLSPIYRAQLFHMIQFPMGGANVTPLEREAARRRNFGTTFGDAYIHREPSCVNCHNAVSSPTYSPDPEQNRFWPVEGRFEAAVFGSDSADGDPLTYWSIFRVMDVKQINSGQGPWGWNRSDCGGFAVPSPSDPLDVDARFASVEGKWASIWGVEEALHRGFEELRKSGLVLGADGAIDPDVAFAYMVAANITEKVWTEVMGTGLTVAHKFPRNKAQRDTLRSLTDAFVKSGFSLKSLLVEIVSHPLFNLPPPDSWCGQDPYSLPAVFNPWSVDAQDERMRGNGVGDAVHHLSSDMLQRATHRALEWAPPASFPQDTDDEVARSAIGLFVSDAKPGFRGLGFQPKLSWEDQYGLCAWPGHDDFISKLVGRAINTPGATLESAVVALKDRLVGEPLVEPVEIAPLEQIFGQPLATSAAVLDSSSLDAALRIACGAYLASPQTLLGGLPPQDGQSVPALTPAEHGFGPSCSSASALFDRANIAYIVSCFDGSLAVSMR